MMATAAVDEIIGPLCIIEENSCCLSPMGPISPLHAGCFVDNEDGDGDDELVIIEQDTPPRSSASCSSSASSVIVSSAPVAPKTSLSSDDSTCATENNNEVSLFEIINNNSNKSEKQSPPPSSIDKQTADSSSDSGQHSDEAGLSKNDERSENNSCGGEHSAAAEDTLLSSSPTVATTKTTTVSWIKQHHWTTPSCGITQSKSFVHATAESASAANGCHNLLLFRPEPLATAPLNKADKKSDDGYFAAYQHYETPSTKLLANNRDEMIIETTTTTTTTKQPSAIETAIATATAAAASCGNVSSNRFSATPIRVKIRQGLLKILKRRSQSGDRLHEKNNKELETEPERKVRLKREQSLDRNFLAVSREQDRVAASRKSSIKAVLSASSLLCTNRHSTGSNVTGTNSSSTIASSVTFSKPLATVISPKSVDDDPENSQYEELPQNEATANNNVDCSADSPSNNNEPGVLSPCSDEVNRSHYGTAAATSSNNSAGTFGSSFKSVSSRLFRRRSSGAMSRRLGSGDKSCSQQPLIVLLSPPEPVPTIPLPSPPHNYHHHSAYDNYSHHVNSNNKKGAQNCSNDKKCGNNKPYENQYRQNNPHNMTSDNEGNAYENCDDEDCYDPLISFVEITPPALTRKTRSKNYDVVPSASSRQQHTSNGVGNNNNNNNGLRGNYYVTPGSLNNASTYSQSSGAINHSIENGGGGGGGGYRKLNGVTLNGSNSNNQQAQLLSAKGVNDVDIIDDDDAFHREFSLALSMLHSQSQDLEKALLVSSNFNIKTPSPTLEAPMKPPRNTSTTSLSDTMMKTSVSANNDSSQRSSPAAVGGGSDGTSSPSSSAKPPLPSASIDGTRRPSTTATLSLSHHPSSKPMTPPIVQRQTSAFVAQSLEQTIMACEPALMTRLRLEPPFIEHLADEGAISADFAKAVIQLTDRVATRMALLREVTANSLSAGESSNDKKIHTLCSAFRRDLNDNDTALLLNSVYGIFKVINSLSDAAQMRAGSQKRLESLFETEKSLLVEVLEINGSGQYLSQQQQLLQNSRLASASSTCVLSGDTSVVTAAAAADDDPSSSKKPSSLTSKPSFTERRRLRQLSQSAILSVWPKYGLAVCVVNFQAEFGDAGAVQLAHLVSSYNNIVELSLPNAGIGPIGGAAIASLLTNECCCIKRVNLAANKLGNEGIKKFLRALEVNKSLRSLNLGANSFSGDACNLEMTHAFSANRTLLELDLSYNDIGDGGASALGFGIKTSGGLEKLRLRRCGLNNGSMAKVLAVLAESKCRLVDLDISVNSLAPTCFSLIVTNLSHSRRAISCQLQSCGVRDLSAMTHDSLRYFRELDLSNSPIGDAGAAQFVRAFGSGNDTLLSLNLNACELTIRAGRELIAAVASSHNVLTTLKLCNNFKLLGGSSAVSSGSLYQLTDGVIRVFEVENSLTGQRIKVYCTLPEGNQLLDMAIGSNK